MDVQTGLVKIVVVDRNTEIRTVFKSYVVDANCKLLKGHSIIEPRHVFSNIWHFDKCRLRRICAASF